jgi:hypothetical protein
MNPDLSYWRDGSKGLKLLVCMCRAGGILSGKRSNPGKFIRVIRALTIGFPG